MTDLDGEVVSDEDEARHDDPVVVASFGTRGEADVAEAKLRAYGVNAAIEDPVEGGAVPIEGEPGVMVVVAPSDREDAVRILDEGA